MNHNEENEPKRFRERIKAAFSVAAALFLVFLEANFDMGFAAALELFHYWGLGFVALLIYSDVVKYMAEEKDV